MMIFTTGFTGLTVMNTREGVARSVARVAGANIWENERTSLRFSKRTGVLVPRSFAKYSYGYFLVGGITASDTLSTS
jgi:hypothetical protein